MHTHPCSRRPARLAGLRALLDLAVTALTRPPRRPAPPTAARLRRDIGLPEIEPVPMAPTIPPRHL